MRRRPSRRIAKETSSFAEASVCGRWAVVLGVPWSRVAEEGPGVRRMALLWSSSERGFKLAGGVGGRPRVDGREWRGKDEPGLRRKGGRT